MADEPDPDRMWALVDEVRAGNRDAFTILYQRHCGMVRSYLHARSNWWLAEDLTSETFARALAGIDRVAHRRSTFGAWLITIARNLLLDNAKKAGTRYEITTAENWDFADETNDPATAVERAQDAVLVHRGLAGLTPDQRQCLVLRFFLGYSVTHVAKAMNRNDGSIRALQFRAIKKLGLLVAGDQQAPAA